MPAVNSHSFADLFMQQDTQGAVVCRAILGCLRQAKKMLRKEERQGEAGLGCLLVDLLGWCESLMGLCNGRQGKVSGNLDKGIWIFCHLSLEGT